LNGASTGIMFAKKYLAACMFYETVRGIIDFRNSPNPPTLPVKDVKH